MPFKSDAQRKLCYLLKGKGQAGSWDCDEWSVATGKKKLPEHVKDQEEKKALKYTNKLPGGIGDKHKPSDFPEDDLKGMYEEEKIHTSDPDIATELATDHLTQDKDYYKKLNKVKDSKEAAMRKVARLWSLPAKISKLAEVITGAGRGLGDEDEGVVNFDSSEGISKAVHKEPKKGPASSLTSVREKPKPYLARKALINATNKTFGTNPTGGRAFNKMSEGPSRNFDFSSIGRPLDPSFIGAPQKEVSKLPTPVNPIGQLSSTLKQVGSSIGNRASGAIRKGVTDWVTAPGWKHPMEVSKRRSQALGAEKAIGGISHAFGQTAEGAKMIGRSLIGMDKQSAGLGDTVSNVGAGAAGAGGALYNAFSGAMGNQQSYDALKEQAGGADLAKTWEGVRGAAGDIGNTFSRIGQNAKNMAPEVLRGVTSLPVLKDIQVPIPESMNLIPKADPNAPPSLLNNKYLNKYVNKYRPTKAPIGLAGGFAADALKNYMNQPPSNQPGVLSKATISKATTGLYNQLPANVQQNLSSMGDAAKGGMNALGQHVKNQAINYEAGRRTAGYALPAVDWMRANPWAKYMLGAGGLALGGYALNKMFNRGGEEEQGDEGNPVESNMAQGYNQQAYGTQNHTQPTLNRGR